MKITFCLLAVLLLTSCSSPKPARHSADAGFSSMKSTDLARPLNAEALGLSPDPEIGPAEATKLQHAALTAFYNVFGRHLPKGFVLDAPATGWCTKQGQVKQLRAAAAVSRVSFRADFPAVSWTEVPPPPEYLTLMHLPADVPKTDLTCYLGKVDGKPAYLFWSDYAESTLLVVDL